MANLQIGSPLHGDEDKKSFEKEGSPLNDEIFDILFPASPDAEETEDKNLSYDQCNEQELDSENEDMKQRNSAQSINKTTKLTENIKNCYNLVSSKNESKNHSQNRGNVCGSKDSGSENELLKSTDIISKPKDNPTSKNRFYSSSRNLKAKLPVTELESILPDDDELLFDFSDASLSDEENEKSVDKSNVSLSDFLVIDEVNDRKQSSKYSVEYSNDKKGKKEMKRDEDFLSKSKISSKDEEDRTGNKGKDLKNNKIKPEKTGISADVEKTSQKKNYGFEDVSDNEEKIQLEPHCTDILDDISDDEISESDTHKKKNYDLQDMKDDKVKKGGGQNEDGNKNMRSAHPSIRFDEPNQKDYDEIFIIGDERLPTLTNYKNVKIIREEGLELRTLKSFMKKSGLYQDLSSKLLSRRLILLFLGVNDIIVKTVSRDCSNMRMKRDKGHKHCTLFRYTSVRYDLLKEINSQVKEISDILPATCDVRFFDLYLFDLDKINENLSVEHYHMYGHHANLSESDVQNNKKIHDLIKNVNHSIHQKSLLLHGIDCTREYQERCIVDFTTEAKKKMIFNMKRIQAIYSKSNVDENIVHEKNVGKEDLRLVLNRMNKKEVKDLREELTKKKREVKDFKKNLQTYRDPQVHRKTTNRNFSENMGSNVNIRDGHTRKGWHSPGRCISPTGWHPVDICRQKEKERREFDKNRKNLKIKNTKSTSPGRKKFEVSKEEKSRNSSRKDRERRIYEKTESSREREMSERKSLSETELRKLRYKQAKEKMEKSSRTSRSSERSMPRNKEVSIKRRDSKNYEDLKRNSPSSDQYPQKSRSSSSTKEQEYDSATSEALRNLAEVHDRSCQMYIDNPQAHPDYNKEYYLFYEAKAQKIQEIGGDPNDYDFLPEWKYVWKIRSRELFREAWLNMKNQCIKMMAEKKVSQEKKITHSKKTVENDHSSIKSSKRKRSHERRDPDYKSKRKNKEKSISPPIEKRQKYEMEKLPNIGGNSSTIIDKSQLDALIEEELNRTINSRSMELASSHEGNDMDDLGLEEVGESVMPFNLGKYVPESKEHKEEKIETSNSADNVLEILTMLSKLGDRLGSLLAPINVLLDKASKEKMRNRSTINIFTDPDKTLFMQLISNKLAIAIEDEKNSVIEKVIYQEMKNRVDGLLKVIEETIIEGLNVQQIAEKSLGMESSEIIKCIKSALELSSSNSFSEDKLIKIYKAVKEKQFRYIERKANVSERSEFIAGGFLMEPSKNISEKNVSAEIPFNLPTRNKSSSTEKYDPFEEEYF